MRTWLEVFDTSGARVAVIEAQVSVSTSERLDEAGTFDLNCVVDEKVIDYLVRDNEVAIYSQEDAETPLLQMYGVIIKPQVQETGDNISIRISGRDLLEELRRKVVGLARTYNAQTLVTIMNDLTSLVSGWTASIESAYMTQIQTARFDGPPVLKAILKSAGQLGLHVRNGSALRTVEIGAFGTAATTGTGTAVRAIRTPSSAARELYDSDEILLVDSISVQEDGDSLVNWAIPMGAGTGSAATTLKNTSYRILNTDNTVYRVGTVPEWPIYRRINDAGLEEYYIDASDGGVQHQATLSFKEIGPVANSTLAKQYAADALVLACIASLNRTRVPLIGYTLTVRKARVALRPGDQIHLTYRGLVPTGGPKATRREVVYIDVDTDLWVMGVQRNISESGITTTLQVNTVDQHIKDDTDLIVEVLDRSEVQNLSIQTMPFGFHDSSERVVQGAGSTSDVLYKAAAFSLKIPDMFTDVVKVSFQIVTRPLYSLTDVGSVTTTPQALSYSYIVYQSTNYPSDLTITIDGVDRTTELGGPWNPSGGNSPVDVTLDISTYIIDAAGGLYQNHTILIGAGAKTSDLTVSSSHPSVISSSVSQGVVEGKSIVLGNVRALF